MWPWTTDDVLPISLRRISCFRPQHIRMHASITFEGTYLAIWPSSFISWWSCLRGKCSCNWQPPYNNSSLDSAESKFHNAEDASKHAHLSCALDVLLLPRHLSESQLFCPNFPLSSRSQLHVINCVFIPPTRHSCHDAYVSEKRSTQLHSQAHPCSITPNRWMQLVLQLIPTFASDLNYSVHKIKVPRVTISVHTIRVEECHNSTR